MATQWFCILKQQCVLWMEFLFRSQPGYRKVRNVHVPFLVCTVYPPCNVQIIPIKLCEPAIRFFFCQVRLLRDMKGPLTEHMEHISAGDHVTQIGSLVHELVLDYSPPPAPCNPETPYRSLSSCYRLLASLPLSLRLIAFGLKLVIAHFL